MRRKAAVFSAALAAAAALAAPMAAQAANVGAEQGVQVLYEPRVNPNDQVFVTVPAELKFRKVGDKTDMHVYLKPVHADVGIPASVELKIKIHSKNGYGLLSQDFPDHPAAYTLKTAATAGGFTGPLANAAGAASSAAAAEAGTLKKGQETIYGEAELTKDSDAVITRATRFTDTLTYYIEDAAP